MWSCRYVTLKSMTVSTSFQCDRCSHMVTRFVPITCIMPRNSPCPQHTSTATVMYLLQGTAEPSRAEQAAHHTHQHALISSMEKIWRVKWSWSTRGKKEIIELLGQELGFMIHPQFTPVTGRWPRTGDECDTDAQQTDSIVPLLQAGTACTHCTAVLPYSAYAHWPAAAHTSARGVGSDRHDGEKHKIFFFPLQAEKEVSHLDMYSSQTGKGTRHWERRSRGHSIAQRM